MRVHQIFVAIWTIGLWSINTHWSQLGGREYRRVIRQGEGDDMKRIRQEEGGDVRKIRQEDGHYMGRNVKRTGFSGSDRQFNRDITSFQDGGLGQAIKLGRFQQGSSIRNKRQEQKLWSRQRRRSQF